LKLSMLWVGRTKDRRMAGLLDDYAERVRRYCRFEIIEIKDAARGGASAPAKRMEEEGRRILRSLRPGELRVALDEGGKELTSTGFASFLGRALEGTPAGVKFIIGGPYGLSEEVKSAAAHRCSLSKMTLTHDMARLVAMDQIYRAFTILRGEGYHH
jgi:23S rRNA (pseudouridine1915-N3)-methyltransferase